MNKYTFSVIPRTPYHHRKIHSKAINRNTFIFPGELPPRLPHRQAALAVVVVKYFSLLFYAPLAFFSKSVLRFKALIKF
jgi:hypothetical protein